MWERLVGHDVTSQQEGQELVFVFRRVSLVVMGRSGCRGHRWTQEDQGEQLGCSKKRYIKAENRKGQVGVGRRWDGDPKHCSLPSPPGKAARPCQPLTPPALCTPGSP